MNETKKLSYKDASGEILYTLKSDIVFHYTMQKSEKALLGLVCALRGIKPSEVLSIQVENPIELNNIGKESVMDLKLTLNSGVIMNIELQMYTDKFWIPRSILYLCRAFDCIREGDDYSKLKETIHYCITDQELFSTEPEFYASYKLINMKNHVPYSDMLGINVLQLQYIDLATEEDVDNDLVYWAKLFKADTWEELKGLVQDHEDMEEVADLIFELNTDDQAKEILEGQRRYREQLASQYAAGRIDAEKEINDLKEKLDGTKEELDTANQTIKELQEEIERLKNNK
ncbi:PD-(D/E)XK nuclease family transposase [Butyrivibrio proteoclasticus]|uniref:PD-(D/E)XK nuclease family transposase n=1 Tax=Butyrivibrio proteoclasticus TaxID=43305 RepID=UPI00047DC297|nr:PD-(D/E)XK nuclease family transposase [Butyrivibrio proteoclasticus]